MTQPDGLVVFDGICNACSAYVRTVARMDRAGVLRFTPAQSPYGRLLCAQHGVDADDPSTFLFFDQGHAREASDAIVAMLSRLPAPWRWLRIMGAVPRPLRDRTYRWIARNRYRMLGRREACMIPSQALKARFVEAVPPGS